MLPKKKDFVEVKITYKSGASRKLYVYGLVGLSHFLLCTKLDKINGVWVNGQRVFGGGTIWYWQPKDFDEYSRCNISIGSSITEKEYRCLHE